MDRNPEMQSIGDKPKNEAAHIMKNFQSRIPYLISIFLLLTILLSGCYPVMPIGGPEESGRPQQGSQTGDNTESNPGDLPDEAPSIMEGREAVSTEGSTYHILCPQLEELQGCTPYVVGDALLLSSVTYDDMGKNSVLHLVTIHQKTGETLGELSESTQNYIALQILGDRICISDAIEGWVRIYDHRLTPEKEYSIRPDDGSWYISSDLQKLYSISWDGGICSTNLTALPEGGNASEPEWTPVLEGVTDVIPSRIDEETLLISYTDAATQMAYRQLFSLTTGTLEDLPLQGMYYQVTQAEGTWLYSDPLDWLTYYVQSGDLTRQITLKSGYLVLLEGGHLLHADYDTNRMILYDGNGGFGMSCTQDNYRGYTDGHWAWSDYYGGYFIIEYDDAENMRLLFMDLHQQQIGAPLALTPYETGELAEGSLVSAQLYQRAEDLSQQYDVDIRIAELCGLEYADFTANMLTNEYSITYALDCLETALAAFPEGFFTQLKCGDLTSIRIEIVHNLKDTRVQEDDDFSEFNGFTREMADYRLMVLDAETMYVDTIYHEFSHMIDARLEYDAHHREGALYSEAMWTELQPEGYTFPYTYADIPDASYEAAASGYFVSVYGSTYPTEDRATIFESAMAGYHETFWAQPVLMEKLAYYCICIRDCFDTEGWPEVTQWEEPLLGFLYE